MKQLLGTALHLVLCVAILSVSGAAAGNPPKVFITDSKSWEMSGGFGGTSDGFGGHVSGGARPQTAEIVKTFGERCPDVTINMKQEKADYVVVVEHEGGKGLIRKDNKVAVFDNHSGDSIYSHSTTTLGGSVKDACAAVKKHWLEKGAAQAEAERLAQSVTTATAPAPPVGVPGPNGSKLQVVSTPTGADIEIDSNFVGNTPSSVVLAVGEHSVSVKKAGCKHWSRKIKLTGGEISISAELEKNEGQHGEAAGAGASRREEQRHVTGSGNPSRPTASKPKMLEQTSLQPPAPLKELAPSEPLAQQQPFNASAVPVTAYIGLKGIPNTGAMGGFQVTEVIGGSPAAKAGLAVNDVIDEIDGKPISTQQVLDSELAKRQPGSSMKINYRHRGTTMHFTIAVTLGSHP